MTDGDTFPVATAASARNLSFFFLLSFRHHAATKGGDCGYGRVSAYPHHVNNESARSIHKCPARYFCLTQCGRNITVRVLLVSPTVSREKNCAVAAKAITATQWRCVVGLGARRIRALGTRSAAITWRRHPPTLPWRRRGWGYSIGDSTLR